MPRLHRHTRSINSRSHVASPEQQEIRFQIKSCRQVVDGLLRSVPSSVQVAEIEVARLQELCAKGIQPQAGPVKVDVTSTKCRRLFDVPQKTLLVQELGGSVCRRIVVEKARSKIRRSCCSVVVVMLVVVVVKVKMLMLLVRIGRVKLLLLMLRR